MAIVYSNKIHLSVVNRFEIGITKPVRAFYLLEVTGARFRYIAGFSCCIRTSSPYYEALREVLHLRHVVNNYKLNLKISL